MPYVAFTSTVGLEVSTGTSSEPWEPSVPWKSSVWTPVPLMTSDVPGVNGAPSRL